MIMPPRLFFLCVLSGTAIGGLVGLILGALEAPTPVIVAVAALAGILHGRFLGRWYTRL